LPHWARPFHPARLGQEAAMARYYELTKGAVGLAWIWNLSHAVGPGCANAKGDVMLVQHALNTITVHFGLTDAKGKPLMGRIVREGKFNDETAEAILAYQRNLKEVRKRYVHVDGRIDPSNREGWTSRTNDQYTIVYLNRDHRDVHGKMMDETHFPSFLQAELKANRHAR
jgi:hypothetical protein